MDVKKLHSNDPIGTVLLAWSFTNVPKAFISYKLNKVFAQ